MKNAKTLSAIILALAMTFAAVSCTAEKPQSPSDTSAKETAAAEVTSVKREGVWQDATYTTDTLLGTGAVTVYVEVIAEDSSVTFILKTDKPTLGEALAEHDLISGEQGDYGLYIKKVNNITADYDEDGYYWSISQNGEMLMTGADSTNVTDGAHYELTRTK